jgi:hypothetical protein
MEKTMELTQTPDWWIIVNQHGEVVFAAKSEEKALAHESGLWPGDELIPLFRARRRSEFEPSIP